MPRRAAELVRQGLRESARLRESDYLLDVCDETRMVAPLFRLSRGQVAGILRRICQVVASFRIYADQAGISRAGQEEMADAFQAACAGKGF